MKWIKKAPSAANNTAMTFHENFVGPLVCLFNIIVAILIGARYAFIIDWPDTLAGKLYFFVSLLGHFSFNVFALYLLVVFPLSFIVKNHRTFRGLTVIFPPFAQPYYYLIPPFSIVLICIYPLLYGICWSIQKMVKCHAIGKFSLHQCQ